MSNEKEYRSSPYLNQSGMKKILISPAHYKAWLEEQLNPEEPERDLRIGLATHSLCLEPSDFNNSFAIAPVCDRRTTIGKATWAEFLESSPGKIALTADEYTVARSCADSVLRNQFFKESINSDGRLVEHSLFLKNDIFKHGIKGRLDLIDKKNGIILDIKTHGRELNKHEIQKTIKGSKYALQKLVYQILAFENGFEVPNYFLIFVEKNEPYASVKVEITSEYLSKEAAEDLSIAVNRFNLSMDTNNWPDLSASTIEI